MKTTYLAAAVAATLVTASAASATTVNFAVSKGGWSTSGHTYGASNEVTVTGATVDTNGKILTNNEKVNSWSGNAGGLGVCDKKYCTGGTGENGHYDQHTVDGKDDAGMALLDFGSLLVEITSVTFSYWDHNDDYDYAVFNSLAVGSMPIVWNEDVDSGTNSSVKTFNFSAGTLVGSLFGFGSDYKDDEFKLKAISYKIVDTPVVPLPAAGWMLLAGVGGLFAAKRRKTA